jgi:hypothetical protein
MDRSGDDFEKQTKRSISPYPDDVIHAFQAFLINSVIPTPKINTQTHAQQDERLVPSDIGKSWIRKLTNIVGVELVHPDEHTARDSA